MINRILVSIALLFVFAGSASAAHYTACGISSEYKHGHWAECAQEAEDTASAQRLNAKPVCIVLHQTGVIRNATAQQVAEAMSTLNHGAIVDCDLSDDNALRSYFSQGKN